MFEIKCMTESEDEGFRMKILRNRFFKEEGKAVDLLIEWTTKYPDTVVVMSYRKI